MDFPAWTHIPKHDMKPVDAFKCLKKVIDACMAHTRMQFSQTSSDEPLKMHINLIVDGPRLAIETRFLHFMPKNGINKFPAASD